MDCETKLTILQLQLEDIEALLSSRKGKEKEGNVSPSEQAFLLQRDELCREITEIEDRALSISMSKAIQNDGAIISLLRAEENQQRRDHEHAIGLQMGQSTMQESVEDSAEGLDFFSQDLIEHFASLNLSQGLVVSEAFQQNNESEHHGPTTECIACTEDIQSDQLYETPCEHLYCKACIVHLVSDAMHDESLFPPRCCRLEMPLSDVAPIIGPKLAQRVELKTIELNTSDRTYCSNPDCSKFLLPHLIRSRKASCPDCAQCTCTDCKREYHLGDCDQVRERELLDLATNSGWQRCYQCQRLVELASGCNHITCRCGGQFCYVCGARWKTCLCAQWDENRLIDRAAIVVDRQPAAGGQNEDHNGIRQRRIDAMAERLRERHECEHRGRWTLTRGRHQCEECLHVLPEYIFECTQCRVRACWRCRRNRL